MVGAVFKTKGDVVGVEVILDNFKIKTTNSRKWDKIYNKTKIYRLFSKSL